MELNVLDSNLAQTGILDTFTSLIWTDRYYGAGDFEITKLPDTQFAQAMITGLYLTLRESEHVMIIEHIEINTDVEEGSRGIIKGRSLESILERRIVYTPTILNGNLQTSIQNLLNDNAINPSNTDRKLTKLEFEASVDPVITALQTKGEYFGETLYKVIGEICIANNIGFKVTLTDLGKFRFKLYAGVDRSYNQSAISYVIFSPSFENLLDSNYLVNNQILRTMALVAGEKGVGNGRTTTEVFAPGGGLTDLNRREMFVDASGVTRNVGGTTLTEQEYLDQLTQKGKEELAKNILVESFEGQADTTTQYVYGDDFLMGDILQVENQYGHVAQSRVVEMIRSQDPSGVKAYPTFSSF